MEQQSGNTGFSDSLPSAAHLFQKVRKIHTADRLCRSGTGRHKWRPADRLCRSGTGRHKWRPYGLRREPADAKQHSTAPKRRGATCDARMTTAMPRTGHHKTTVNRRKRRGATCDARMTDAMPRTGQYKTTNRPSADRLCRSGTGRHKWRPYGLRREPADAKQHSTAPKRRGATCDARMTDAMPRTGHRKTTVNRRKRRGATCDARKTAGVTPRPDAGDDRQGASRRTPV